MANKKLVYSSEQYDENCGKSPEELGFFRTKLGWRKMVEEKIELEDEHEGIHPNSKYDHGMPDLIRSFFDVSYTFEKEIVNYNSKGEEIVTYKTVANPLPTFQGFCRMIKVSSDKVRKWQDRYPEFELAYQECKDIQFDMWVHNTNAGYYNIAFSIYYGKAVMKLHDRPEAITVKNINYDVTDKLEDMTDEEIESLGKKYGIL